MGIIIWAIIGLVAGAIAKAIYPGEQSGGLLGTMLLGILGSQVGGWVGRQLLDEPATSTIELFFNPQQAFPVIATAVAGAIGILFIWGILTRPSR